MKHIITLLLIIATAATVAAQDIKLPAKLTIGNDTYEDCTYTSHDAAFLTFTHDSGMARVEISKLPEALQKALGYDAAEAAVESKKSGVATTKAELKKEYDAVKKNTALLRKHQSRYIEADQKVVDTLAKAGEIFIAEYEKGGDDIPEALATNRKMWKHIYDNKEVLGYQYNEILKKDVTIDINFGLFKDVDSFYIKVGDGNFSTLARLSLENLVSLAKEAQRVNEWVNQCREERLDTRKDVGRFGGVSFEFVSNENGEVIYLLMTAKGAFRKDSMVESQTVRLNLLNWRCLLNRISKAEEMVNKRDQQRKNAEKLR